MKVRWSETYGFEILDFPINCDIGFSLINAIAKYARVLYNLITGLLRFELNLNLRTARNHGENKDFLKLVLTGELKVTVVDYLEATPFFPVPDIDITLNKMKDPSFSNLSSKRSGPETFACQCFTT